MSAILPVEFLFAAYVAWFKQTNPSGRLISCRKFRDRLKVILDGVGAPTFRLMGRDDNPVAWTQYWSDEPLAKEYGYALGIEWADTSAGHPLFFENHPRGRGLVRLQPQTQTTTI